MLHDREIDLILSELSGHDRRIERLEQSLSELQALMVRISFGVAAAVIAPFLAQLVFGVLLHK